MDYTLFINFINCNNHIFDPLVDGKSALEFLIERIGKTVSENQVVAIVPNSLYAKIEKGNLLPSNWNIKKLSSSTNAQFLELFLEIYKSGNLSPYVVIDGDAPFIDLEGTLALLENHKKFGVQLSNADGFPLGLYGEILDPEVVSAFVAMGSESKTQFANGATFFDYITPRINQFDIETHLPPKDYGIYRLRLKSSSVADNLLCCRVAKALAESGNRNFTSNTILQLLDENQIWFRTRPNYFNIQITTKNNQRCSYFPWNSLYDSTNLKPEMDKESVAKIAKDVFEFCGEGVFTFWPIGEPALHSQIEQIVESILSYPTFKLLIETNGIGWDKNLLARLKEKYEGRLIWIITLDTIDEAYYSKLRGEGFSEAFKTAKFIYNLFKENCYIQAVRIKGHEDQLAEFWKYWKENGQPLVTKFDYYCGLLEDLRVVDLSPVERFACWHIKRDINVLVDGRVVLCKEDVGATTDFGNIITDGVASCFENLNSCYEKQCRGCYDGLCKNCDEYYTFNF